MQGNNHSTTFTSVDDQQLYDEFSRSRRKSDFPMASSSSSSPNLVRSPHRGFSTPKVPQKTVTIFDQIVEWFQGEINIRRRFVAFASGYLAMITFILTVSVLKLSIWAPFSSVQDALTWWLYPSQSGLIIIPGLLSAGLAAVFASRLCRIDQLPRIPVTDTLAWAAVIAEFLHRLFFVHIAFGVSDSSFSTEFAWISIVFSIFVSSALVIFRNDFHLDFSPVQINSLKTFVTFVKSQNYAHLGETCAIDAAIAYTAGMALILVFGPVFWGFSTWWLLINIGFHFVLFGICFTQHVYSKLFIKIVNQIVMKPMQFPFPPPYTVHTPTPDQIRTLPNVIETADPLLKMFALHDLRTIAWTDEQRRADVFALSQPGKHARNWKSVSLPCSRTLDELCSRITIAAARLVGYSWDDHDEYEENPRDALLMPRRMREMAYRGNGPSRQQRNMAPIRSLNTQTGGFMARINKIFGFGAGGEKAVISRLDAQMNAYAAEALYMLVVDSLGEDRFGVVQKDLKELMSLLCKLISAIDTFDRARASVADKSDVTFLRIVDSSLKSSLQRVVTTFGSHLRSLNLAEEHVRTIRLVCQITDEL